VLKEFGGLFIFSLVNQGPGEGGHGSDYSNLGLIRSSGVISNLEGLFWAIGNEQESQGKRAVSDNVSIFQQKSW
jgi:hypothetical protein